MKMIEYILDLRWDKGGVELEILDGTVASCLINKGKQLNGRRYSQVILIDVPLTSATVGNVRVGVYS